MKRFNATRRALEGRWTVNDLPHAWEKNDPERAGEVAGDRVGFGPWTRFCVYPVHTRFDALAYVITDVEASEPTIAGISTSLRETVERCTELERQAWAEYRASVREEVQS